MSLAASREVVFWVAGRSGNLPGAFFSGLFFSRKRNALRRYQLFPANFRYSLARLGLYADLVARQS